MIAAGCSLLDGCLDDNGEAIGVGEDKEEAEVDKPWQFVSLSSRHPEPPCCCCCPAAVPPLLLSLILSIRTNGAVNPPSRSDEISTVTIVAETTTYRDSPGKDNANANAIAPRKPAKLIKHCALNGILCCLDRQRLIRNARGKTLRMRPSIHPNKVSPIKPQSQPAHARGSHAERPRYANTTVSARYDNVRVVCAVVSLAASDRLYQL